MTQPLVNQFRYLGNTHTTQQVLNGNYTQPPGTDYYTSQWFAYNFYIKPTNRRELAQPQQWILTEYHKESWKKINKCTVTSVLGLTAAHFKTNTKDQLLVNVNAALAIFFLRDWILPKPLEARHQFANLEESRQQLHGGLHAHCTLWTQLQQ